MDLLVEECCHSLLLSHPAGAWIEQEEVSREAGETHSSNSIVFYRLRMTSHGGYGQKCWVQGAADGLERRVGRGRPVRRPVRRSGWSKTSRSPSHHVSASPLTAGRAGLELSGAFKSM